MNIDELVAWSEAIRQSYRSLFPGSMERTFATMTIMAAFYFLLVMAVERACGTRTGHYRSRGFAHDIGYYVYVKLGFQKYVIPMGLFAILQEHASASGPRILDGLPYPAQFVVWLVVSDFIQYWMHRAKHHFRFLWAFHTTHHSQEQVNFMTFARIHPGEDFIGQFVHVFVLFLLGADALSWFVIAFLMDAIDELQHTQIPWRFGPLYRVFVTPAFHMYHHSTDPAHHDRNFGVVLSVWDHLFGTTVPPDSAMPTRYGLDDVKPTSFWSTLSAPFVLLYRFYVPGETAARGE